MLYIQQQANNVKSEKGYDDPRRRDPLEATYSVIPHENINSSTILGFHCSLFKEPTDGGNQNVQGFLKEASSKKMGLHIRPSASILGTHLDLNHLHPLGQGPNMSEYQDSDLVQESCLEPFFDLCRPFVL